MISFTLEGSTPRSKLVCTGTECERGAAPPATTRIRQVYSNQQNKSPILISFNQQFNIPQLQEKRILLLAPTGWSSWQLPEGSPTWPSRKPTANRNLVGFAPVKWKLIIYAKDDARNIGWGVLTCRKRTTPWAIRSDDDDARNYSNVR